ncbi:MAG: mandelate racemase/muconate lactonizing enzyme family protein [Phycisphaerae bacterium]
MSVHPVRLEIYRTAIPTRGFSHAAASRDMAEAVVVRLVFSDGSVGWGETLPRPYVTGETLESVVADLSEHIWPMVRQKGVGAGEMPELPVRGPDGRCMNAAACAVDLACIQRFLSSGGGRDALSNRIRPRVSGVLGSADPRRTLRRLKWMLLGGLRDFKLKLGFGEQTDAANLDAVCRRLGGKLAAGKATLRVDVNGAWSAEETPYRTAELKKRGVCVVEQPVFAPAEQFVELARRCELPLMADESLLTESDAGLLLAEPKRVWWNIRLSKNGGLARCRSLAELADAHGVEFTIGCMVGESGILSAAQRRLLQMIPEPRFVEGNYGRLLLRDDLTRPSPHMGFGGRLKPLGGGALGVSVRPEKLSRYGRLVATLE